MKSFARWMSSRRPHSTSRKPHGHGLRVESLEDRLQPSTLFVDSTGLLTYTAGSGVANQLTISLDPATDTYRFSDAEVINAPGFLGNGTNSVSVPNAAVSSMKVLLGDAADALTVESAADRIQVQAGTGDDQITLVSPGGTLDGIRGRISVAGEDGFDVLTVNDQGAAAGKGYVLTASSLTRAGFLLVDSYGTLERVNLNTTGLNDNIVVRGTSNFLAVNAGVGADTMTVGGAAGGLDGIQGSVAFDGHDGAGDRLIVDDTGSSAGQTFIVQSNTVRRGSQHIVWSMAESVVVRAGAFNDTFGVQGTQASTPVTLNTGDGSDTVTVGALVGFSRTLDFIQGALTVNGQAGTGDVLDISEAGNTASQSYTVTSTSVSRFGAALIKYGTVESVVVVGTAETDAFSVRSTAAGTTTTLRAGAGFEQIHVGTDGPSATLDFIQGALAIDLGTDYGALILSDQGTGSGQTYTVTSTSVSRSGMAPITYSGSDFFLHVSAGGFNDVVNVRSTAAHVPVNVFLGKGDDTANVGNRPTLFSGSTLGGIQGRLVVGGGDGQDVLNLNDQQVGIVYDPNPTGQSYVISHNSVSRSGAADILGATLEGVALNTTSGDDTITVAVTSGTPVAVNPVAVNAGDGADTIRLVQGVGGPGRPVTVNGQGGIDTLDYSSLTIDVRVNLALGTATALAGVGGVENVTGGSGNDVLIGDAVANVLRGGFGRDLLIGREGADHLFGDAGEDILIGNATALDADPTALEAITAEWTRSDRSYSQRVQNLKLGGGYNGAVKLDLTKLIEDGAQDRLTGGGDALDWFFLTGADLAPDLNQPALEQVN